MRALAVTLLVLVGAALAGCSGAAAPAQRGIAAETPVLPEERSTCAALARVDLAVVDADPTSLRRDADTLDQAATRAPADVRPALGSLAAAYRAAAEAPGAGPGTAAAAADDLPTERAATDLVGWFNAHCGGFR
jgi:hypothetical protein